MQQCFLCHQYVCSRGKSQGLIVVSTLYFKNGQCVALLYHIVGLSFVKMFTILYPKIHIGFYSTRHKASGR